MSSLLTAIHVIVCIALIMIVLLQTGKGADMGASFGGGGSQTLFGASGGGTFLGKATTFAAVIFMLTSLCLAYMSGNKMGDSIMLNREAPAVEETTAAPEEGNQATQPSASETTQPSTSETTQPSTSETTQPSTSETMQPSAPETQESSQTPATE